MWCMCYIRKKCVIYRVCDLFFFFLCMCHMARLMQKARNLTLSHKDLCKALVSSHKRNPCLFGQLDVETLALTVGC